MKWWTEFLYRLGLERASLKTEINRLQAALESQEERNFRLMLRNIELHAELEKHK